MKDDGASAAAAAGTLVPAPYVIVRRREEAADVVTLSLEPSEGPLPGFRHGQFNMVTSFGRGEIAVSMSSAPGAAGPLEHSIRRVGAVSTALCDAAVGSVVGIRGPFGTSWGIDELEDGTDVVVMGGGIGLAPLRGAVRDLVARQEAGRGAVFVLAGARSPDQILFQEDLEAWRGAGAHVGISVDVAAPGWRGVVGVVTELLPLAPFTADTALALLCGPEVMMRFAGRALVDRGVEARRIRVSLERNMQCGVGLCGHCQLGPLLVCRDGPVVPYGGLAEELFMERNR
jgi:anaerobic sulfite reductase subunit B